MYSLTADPYVANRIAQQRIDDRLREADARRLAREVHRLAHPGRPAWRPQLHVSRLGFTRWFVARTS
jgi:hypothetical protein